MCITPDKRWFTYTPLQKKTPKKHQTNKNHGNWWISWENKTRNKPIFKSVCVEQLNGYNSNLSFLINEMYILKLSLVVRGLAVSGHFYTLKSECHCASPVFFFTKTVWNMINFNYTLWNYSCLHVFSSRLLNISASFSLKFRFCIILIPNQNWTMLNHIVRLWVDIYTVFLLFRRRFHVAV